MSQRKKVNNSANNFSLKDQFLQQTGRPVPQNRAQPEKEVHKCYEWERWTIILSKDMKRKIMAIADKERFSIRDVIEKFFTDGIAAYEAKHGIIDTTLKKKKNIDNLT